MWKVVQIDQYGVEVVVFRGEADDCDKWILENEELEQMFDYYVEPITCRGGQCE